MRRNFSSGTGAWLACVTCAIGAPLPVVAADADAPAIVLSKTQMEVAGIQLAVASPVTAASSDGDDGVRLTGQVLAPGDGSQVVMSMVAGQVESVLVQIGGKVARGQPLAKLYSAELAGLQREYVHARAEADVAKSRVARDEALFKDGIIAESRLRETRAAHEIASASEQGTRRLLSLAGFSDAAVAALTADTISSGVTVSAREAGVVLEQPVLAGQRVEPGTTLFRIAQPGRWWLDLQASTGQRNELRPGDIVRVSGCERQGKVIAVGTQVNALSQTVPVRAEISDASSCLRLNQYVEVDVHPASVPANMISVPASAIVRNGERSFVFVRDGDAFKPVPVTIQRRQGRLAWLREGPAAGASVASSGTSALKGVWLGLGATMPDGALE